MTLSIKDHIEAGHYERDTEGRSLVPHIGGDVVTIYATNGPEGTPIIGWLPRQGITTWSGCTQNLLPPPRRKVEVKASLVCVEVIKGAVQEYKIERVVRADGGPLPFKHNHRIELTGSYEEEW